MRTRIPVAVVVMTLAAAGAFHAPIDIWSIAAQGGPFDAGAIAAQGGQIANPIPAPIEKRGLSVEIADLVRLPDTRGLRPADQDVSPAGWARINFVKDSRGFLYVLDRNNQPSVYVNVGALFPFAVYNRLESGFIGFEFHPEF